MSWSLPLHIVACVAVPILWGAAVHLLFHHLLARPTARRSEFVSPADVDELPS